MALAVAVTLATPLTSVTALGLDNIAVAPFAGAVNVTMTPLNGLPAASVTVTCSAFPNTAPIAANCSVPPKAVMRAGEPKLVNENGTFKP